MSTKHFLNIFFILKNHFNLFLFLILLIIQKIHSINELLQGTFPKTLLLQDGNLFLTNVNGMYICDMNLETIINSQPYDNTQINSNINEMDMETIYKKIAMAQFPEENGMIICLVENIIYFLGSDGNLILKDNLPSEYTISSSILKLTIYKKEDDYIHYFITFSDSIDWRQSLFILYYKVNDSENILITTKIFRPFYFDYPSIRLDGYHHACQIMNSASKGKVLTCCFQTQEFKFIIIQSFIIENNLEEIGEDIFAKVASPHSEYIDSIISNDGKKLLTFYNENNNRGYYFIFDIDTNMVIENEPIIENCQNSYLKYNLFYLSKTKEYFLMCSSNNNKFTIIKMNETFSILNKYPYSTYNFDLNSYYNTFNLIYNETDIKYSFIIDKNDGSQKKTGIYEITTTYQEECLGQSKPSPFEEDPPISTEYNLPNDNKYYLKVLENYRTSATVNDKNGKIIDFLDRKKPILLTQQDEPIKPSIYALNMNVNNLRGRLYYIINNEEIPVETGIKIFGAFKLKYYLSENDYGQRDSFSFKVFLRNYSSVMTSYNYEISVCKKNCSCEFDTGSCPSCADGYGFFERNDNCVAGISVCTKNFYDDNITNFIQCVDECPIDYPFYNNKTKECKQKEIENPENDFVIDNPNTESDSVTSQTETPTQSNPNIPTTNPTNGGDFTDNNSQENTDNTKTEPIDSSNNYKGNSNSEEYSEGDFIDNNSQENNDNTKTESIDSSNYYEGNSNSEENSENETYLKTTIDTSKINNIDFETKEIINKIINWILAGDNAQQLEYFEELNQPDKGYQILSYIIKNGNITISSGDRDITLKGDKTIYQITSSENQKNADEKSDFSIIDLGECEKIIKRNISYEDDTTPLIIFKIDINNEKMKSPLVQYEVYNPYTKEKINLDICKNIKIKILSPVNLTSEETALYDDLKKYGYDLYNANDSFYQSICTQYTTSKGTDIIISDRKNYYYDKDANFCDNSCTYEGINTETKKVDCICEVKNEVDFESPNFDKEKFFEKFYKVEDYTNYQVLFCYKLVFSSKGLKNNICFYIFIIIFILFLSTMIVNLFKALKKIDEIIFKIFQDKFMFEIMKNILRNKKVLNVKEKNSEVISNHHENDNKKEEILPSSEETSKNLNFFQKLRLKYKKNKVSDEKKDNNKNNNNKNNINNNINNNKNNSININKNENNKKINNLKSSINDKKNIAYRMNCKIDYSNNLRDKNFNFGNIFNEIMNKDNKNSSSLSINNRYDIGKNNNIENINNSTKILSNLSSNRSYKNYNNKRKTTLNNKFNFNNNIFNINLRNSCTNSSLIKSSLNNNLNINNNNDINPNPPLKKNSVSINNIINKQQSESQIQNRDKDKDKDNPISDKDSFKYQKRKSMKRKNKIKILRKSLDVYNNIIISNNIGSMNSKNEDTTSKNQLLYKSNLVVDEKKNVNDNNNNIIEEKTKEKKDNKNVKYIDEELNKMDYENALLYDKRTYLQYYLSLLKKKHLIILVFISNHDYNVFLLKFSLFIVSISLFFSLNTLFFRDSTMKHIFTNEGRYNLLYQIPQILYSTIISSVITYILKVLSLSQSDLIEIKKESDKSKAKNLADKCKKCLKIKLYIFFSIGLSLLIFCWYYITAFGAVYPNTQSHLIKDTLISFGISMLYPFIINIIPGLMRIPALNSKNKDQNCMYKISQIVAYL